MYLDGNFRRIGRYFLMYSPLLSVFFPKATGL